MNLALLLFLGGVGFDELLIGLVIAFIPAFFLGRSMLRSAFRQGPSSINKLSTFLGLMIAPSIFMLIAAIVSAIAFTVLLQDQPGVAHMDETEESDTTSVDPTSVDPTMPRQSLANPRAVALLKEEFYWSPFEAAGPFGNFSGREVWTGFLQWRKNNTDRSPVDYRDMFLKDDPLNAGVGDPSSTLRAKFRADNATIAVGMSQFILEGRMNADVKDLTRQAIEQQLAPEMLALFGDEAYQDVRRRILEKMLKVLEKIES